MIITPEMARLHWLPWGTLVTEGEFRVYKHVKLLSHYIGRCISGENPSRRLLVECCPQHGKSELCSKIFPTWYLGKNPTKKTAIISHGQDLASKFGDYNREIFAEYGPKIFGLEVDRSSRSREWWRVRGYPKGGLVSVGIGGSLIGQTCHGVIFDDPYKNPEEANNPRLREKIWDTFRTVAATRVTKDSWMIVIHQRFHADDLIGKLKQENEALPEHEKWETISLKAIATEDEYWPDGEPFRRAGEALWPEHKNLEFLERQRRTLGPYYFSCLYQQSPSQYEGAMWHPDLFANVTVQQWPEKLDHLVVALDPAGGLDVSKGDYPAIVAMGTCGDGLLYIDSVMQRCSPRQVADNLAQLCKRLPRIPDAVLCERFLFQEIYFEQIAKSMLQHNVFCPIYPIEHGGVPKTDRLMRLDGVVSNKMLRFIASKDTMVGLQQLKNFPHPQEHDDFPDALEMCLRGLTMTAKMKPYLRARA